MNKPRLIAGLFAALAAAGVAFGGGGGFSGASGSTSVSASSIVGVIPAANLPATPGVSSATDDSSQPVLTVSSGVFVSTFGPHYFSLASTGTPTNLRAGMIWRHTAGVAYSPDGSSTINLGTLGGHFLLSRSKTASYTAVSSDSVVFADNSAGFTAPIAITLPSAASAVLNGAGKTIQVTKVDASTNPVDVITTAGDLISGTTGLVRLNAQGQSVQLVSDGGTAWWPSGLGIQMTPMYLGETRSGANTHTNVASATIACPFNVPVPSALLGIRQPTGNTWGANTLENIGIYRRDGTLLVQRSSATLFSNNSQFTSTFTVTNLPPGFYYVAVQLNNVGNLVLGQQNNSGNGGGLFCSRTNAAASFTLPTSLAFPLANGMTVDPSIQVIVAGGANGL